MSTRPFLEDIEKKWLAFQLLCALRDCHARDVFHGDIKTENILVTSWNWLYLSDFSSSFKPTTLPEDNPADFSYFFDTAGRRTCYLAPERFLAPGEEPDPKAKVTWAMDVFSVGCVIAELFLETPIFNLSQLYKYKKGEYGAMAQINGIADKDIRDLVAHMIQVEPEARYSAEEYLNFWRTKAFPEYFYSFLHQYMALITDPTSGRAPISGASVNLGEADDRIDRIYYDFDKISYFLGYQNNKLEDGRKAAASQFRLQLLPVHLNIPNNDHQVSSAGRRPEDDGTLIFLTLVVASVRNTARATARVRACDLLLAFAERLTDEAKLDRVLPYVVSLLSDNSDIVKIAAIRTLTQLMAMVKVISPVNSHVFQEYILDRMAPFLDNPKSNPSPIVRATYAACLGSLATTASRFLDMVATLRADGSLPTVDPEAENLDNSPVFYGLFDNARAELIEIFEGHTKALITDSDSSVRQAFLGSVPELCMFFGTADSNDIILSHLNTYLNGRDWELKCAFFETIVGVATFLGGVSLEEFILPLMVQALTDPEEFVVEKVLRSLGHMAELGLFQRSKTWELVDVVGRFTMHPNIWIREAAAMFIASSTIFLSTADAQCIVLPLIRPYLKSDVRDFSELRLLDTLKKPLPRPVLDLATTWALKVDRGIFWRSAPQEKTFSFGSTNHTIPTTSGKDVMQHALSKIPKNEEDEQWITRLRTQGLTAEDEFKLLALREYIWRMSHLKSKEPPQHAAYLDEMIALRKFGITPQTVMFDEAFENPSGKLKAPSEKAENPSHTIADALLDASMTIDDTSSRRRQKGYSNHQARLEVHNSTLSASDLGAKEPSSIASSPNNGSPKAILSPPADSKQRHAIEQLKEAFPSARASDDDSSSIMSARRSNRQSNAMSLLNRKDTTKSFPQTSTTSTNAFGRVEGPFKTITNQPSALALGQTKEEAKQADIKYRAAHTYSGHDPSILQMLDAMYIENYPDNMLEFGPMVAPLSRRKPITRSSAQAVDKPWQPAGILVAQFSEHVGPVNRVIVAPDHVFFLTAGDDGAVKVWDTGRLERNIAHRSRQTHRQTAGAQVKAICFIENTHCFASCGSDGSVNVVKVDFVYHSGVTAARYGKLKVIREYQLPKDEYAVWCEHFRVETNSILMLATNRSRLVALDLRTMSILYVLENPTYHGALTCFVVDRKRQWILAGTSHGVLDLWDLRFKIRVRGWGVPGASSIHRICMHPFKGKGKWVCVAGGSDHGEVTTWDLERFQCREVYRAGGSVEEKNPKNYEPWSVDDDKPEGMLGRFATSLDIYTSKVSGQGICAMVAGTDAYEDGRELKYGFLLTGGSDRKLRFWDMGDAKHSVVVSGSEVDEPQPTFTTSHPTPGLTLNIERLPRPEAPTAPNAATRSRSSPSTGKTAEKKSSRSTVMTLHQQLMLRTHLDAITDVALLESPYGMTVSVDRSGCTYVFQ